MKGYLEKRFHYLFTGESFAVIMFIFLSFLLNKVYPSLKLYSLYSFWCSFFLLEFLLVQGSMYWYSKWNRLRKENISVTPIRVVQRLEKLKRWNIWLIIIIPVSFLIDFLTYYSSLPARGLSIAVFIYIFAILEYINYFHIQLSYDNCADINYLIKHKRLKQACLSKDFERIK